MSEERESRRSPPMELRIYLRDAGLALQNALRLCPDERILEAMEMVEDVLVAISPEEKDA